MRRHPRRARVSSSSPRAWATCDKCGFVLNHENLRWQLQWAGQQLINQQILVCEHCYDTPQRQLGTIILPPDPEPIINARPEQYSIDEVPVSTRATMDGRTRMINGAQPYPILRIVTVRGNLDIN